MRNVGDKVSTLDPKYPGVWTIIKVNPTTYRLKSDRSGALLRASHSLVTDPVAPGDATVTAVPAVHYWPGEVVSLSPDKYTGDLFVVLADKGDRVNVAKLGGDDGAYLRAPRVWLTKVGMPQLAKWVMGK